MLYSHGLIALLSLTVPCHAAKLPTYNPEARYLNPAWLNGYNEWTTNANKRALVVTVFGRTGDGELNATIFDGWFMKRFLEKQGYEVVWLKDFTIESSKLDEFLYKSQRNNFQKMNDPLIREKVKAVYRRHFETRKVHIDRFEKDYNFPGFHTSNSNVLQCVTKQQDRVDQPSKKEEAYRSTKTNVVAKLRDLADITKSGDSAFFYFSGHGDKTLFGTNKLLLTPEKGKKGSSKLTDSTLYENFTVRLCEGSHAVLMFDACCSGRMGNLRYRLNPKTKEWTEHSKKRTWPRANVISISGCNDNELANTSDYDRHGSVLTKVFLDMMKFSSTKSDGNNSGQYQTRFEHPLKDYVKRMYTSWKIGPFLHLLRLRIQDEKDGQTPQIECSFEIDARQKCLGEFMGPRPTVE